LDGFFASGCGLEPPCEDELGSELEPDPPASDPEPEEPVAAELELEAAAEVAAALALAFVAAGSGSNGLRLDPPVCSALPLVVSSTDALALVVTALTAMPDAVGVGAGAFATGAVEPPELPASTA
jgi:hypothetical protein